MHSFLLNYRNMVERTLKGTEEMFLNQQVKLFQRRWHVILFIILCAFGFILERALKTSSEEKSVSLEKLEVTEKKGSHGDFNTFVAGRNDVLSLSEKFFSYETPFVHPDSAASHKVAFETIPSNVFPPPRPVMVDIWKQMHPFALEYTVHEGNEMFNPCDAAVLYAFVRHTKPRRVYEVGSGFSTRVVKDALSKNSKDNGIHPKHLCIEPYRAELLKDIEVEVIVKPIQEVDLNIFDELESGDILFLDNSHVVKPYGDVVFEILWILPRLKPGVRVHIHDIFLPHDYPERWMTEEFRPYTEQYMLAAFLHNNHAWDISFHNNGQLHKIPNADEQSLKFYNEVCEKGFGASIYLTKVG